MNIPGMSEILTTLRLMPHQFEALVTRLDRMIELTEEQNELLRLLRTEVRNG